MNSNKQSVFIKAGTLIITIQGSIGRIAKTQYDAYIDRTLLVFKSFNIPIVLDYFKYELYLLFELEKTKAPGGTIKTITKEVLSDFKISFPSLPEQQKIASFLTAIDAKIELLTKKKALLEQYKKGAMQQLFSQQIRFKDEEGNVFPEWVEKKLEDIAIKIQDGTHFSPSIDENGSYLYLTSKNVKNGYIDLSNAQYISKESHDSIYKRCDVKFGDVLLTKDGTIGQVCINELKEPFSLLSSVAFVRLTSDYSNYFLYHLLTSPIGQKEIDSQIAGQALKRITLSKINNFKYSFPCFAEQVKIADFLSAIDAKVNIVDTQIKSTLEYKRGLLQQLFA